MSKTLRFVGCTSKVSLLIKRDDVIRGLCTFGCGNDRSLYIWPFSRKGQYFYGSQSLDTGTIEKSFRFDTQQAHSGKRPHVSIHESGIVRIRAGRVVAGPITIPSLASLSGQHTATIRADRIVDLPEFDSKPVSKSEKYCLKQLEPTAESVKAIVYINGHGPIFRVYQDVTFMLPGDQHRIWVGVAVVPDKPIGTEPTNEGITVIAGWNPAQSQLAEQRFVFLRSV